jgi:hypothetical protein
MPFVEVNHFAIAVSSLESDEMAVSKEQESMNVISEYGCASNSNSHLVMEKPVHENRSFNDRTLAGYAGVLRGISYDYSQEPSFDWSMERSGFPPSAYAYSAGLVPPSIPLPFMEYEMDKSDDRVYGLSYQRPTMTLTHSACNLDPIDFNQVQDDSWTNILEKCGEDDFIL